MNKWKSWMKMNSTKSVLTRPVFITEMCCTAHIIVPKFTNGSLLKLFYPISTPFPSSREFYTGIWCWKIVPTSFSTNWSWIILKTLPGTSI